MKRFFSMIARVFRVKSKPVVHDTGMDNPIYDILYQEYKKRNADFTLDTKRKSDFALDA